jgi:hypothetical protein
MHFGEAELFPLGENMFMPGKSSVEVELEIFDVFRLVELHIVDMDRWAGRTSRSEDDMGRLGFVGFHSPFFEASFELQVGPFVGSARQRLDRCIVGEGGRKRTR